MTSRVKNKFRAVRGGSNVPQTAAAISKRYWKKSVKGSGAGRIVFTRVEERPPSGKPVLDPVPVGDVRLANLPAEEYDFDRENAREIDQALLCAFAHAAITIDLVDARAKIGNQTSDIFVFLKPLHQIRRVGIQILGTNHH